DVEVDSFDGTDITTHFHPANGLAPGKTAPTILVGHGWGGVREDGGGSPAAFLAEGYNVLTWDARGFGQSGGTVMIDHPRFEARDVSSLVDFVAEQPQARLDGPGDPRIGMTGGSYGGGIQFISAARDERIDAIAPTIAWHNLLESLYPRHSIKAGWDLALIGVGIPTSVALGIFNPNGIETGHQSKHFYNSAVSGLATGLVPEEELPWFQAHGPDFLLKKVDVPTLIAQGTVDTLFNLDQGHRNYVALHRQGIPLKMMWFCGGHGICNVDGDGSGTLPDSARVQKRRLQWFDRYLKRERGQRTGPAFEWIDQNGTWHTSGAYPLKKTGSLTGAGAGTVPLIPGINPTSGILVAADPDPLATIKVPIAAEGGEDVVGAPKLEFTYSALGVSPRADGLTHVFGQIVDKDRNVVSGNQSTPIPIELDNQSHDVSTSLTRIASEASPAGYELQIIGQSNLFDAQRATGVVTISGLEVRLPTTKPRK
ncbi:MAG: alpha/beta hydrolase, partial [Actinomycetota bacterium]|nr:alpha/beta hydrolase [Actinomycetota bacterium]